MILDTPGFTDKLYLTNDFFYLLDTKHNNVVFNNSSQLHIMPQHLGFKKFLVY